MESHFVFRPVVAIPFVLMLAFFVMLNRLCSRLERDHAETWKQLGRPVFPSFGLDAISNSWNIMSVLLRRRYASLLDPTLRRMGDVCLLLYVLAIVSFVSFVLFPGLADYGILRSDTAATPPLRPSAAAVRPP